jgi:hypothetical protein
MDQFTEASADREEQLEGEWKVPNSIVLTAISAGLSADLQNLADVVTDVRNARYVPDLMLLQLHRVVTNLNKYKSQLQKLTEECS